MASLVDDKQYFMELYSRYRNLIRSQRGYNHLAAKARGLTGQERYILGLLSYEPGASKKRIAEYLSVLMPSITKSLERLENKGLIEKRSCGKDGRVCKHYLTEKSEKLTQEIFNQSHHIWKKAFNNMSEAKVKAFNETLLKLTKILEEESSELLEKNCQI